MQKQAELEYHPSTEECSFVENARLQCKVIRERRHQCWACLTACCLLNSEGFRQNLLLTRARHDSSRDRIQSLKPYKLSWSRQPASIRSTTEDPDSQTSVQMYKCVLVFALLDVVVYVHCKNSLRIFTELFKCTRKEIQQTGPWLMYNRAASSPGRVHRLCKIKSQRWMESKGSSPKLALCKVVSFSGCRVSVPPDRHLAICPGPALNQGRRGQGHGPLTPGRCWRQEEGGGLDEYVCRHLSSILYSYEDRKARERMQESHSLSVTV